MAGIASRPTRRARYRTEHYEQQFSGLPEAIRLQHPPIPAHRCIDCGGRWHRGHHHHWSEWRQWSGGCHNHRRHRICGRCCAKHRYRHRTARRPVHRYAANNHHVGNGPRHRQARCRRTCMDRGCTWFAHRKSHADRLTRCQGRAIPTTAHRTRCRYF